MENNNENNENIIELIRKYFEIYQNQDTSLLDIKNISVVLRAMGYNPSELQLHDIIVKATISKNQIYLNSK